MKHRCRVMGDVELIESHATFPVKEDSVELTVLSEGKEAIKDYIFIREGQSIIIDGEVRNGQLFKDKAQIVIGNDDG